MRGYLRKAHRVSHALLDVPGLARVTASFAMWAKSVGSKTAADRLVAARRDCRLLQRSVAASYRVWWRWTDEGKAWWIEVTVSNGSDHRLGVDLRGVARGTGLKPTESRNPHPQLQWGGSSDDEIGVDPHSVVRTPVALGADADVNTTASGSIEVLRADALASQFGHGGWWCSLPVPFR